MLQGHLQPLCDNTSHYSTLPTLSSIRLLTVHSGDASSKIRCSLRVVDLEDSPKFKALSYSWAKDKSWVQESAGTFATFVKSKFDDTSDGVNVLEEEPHAVSSETPRIIQCNGRTMNVYPNLYDALLQLRASSPGDYWIDAVCMNEGDTLERNAQVRMMGRIYKCAEIVTVWLGTCPHALSPAVARLEQLRGSIPRDFRLNHVLPNSKDPGALALYTAAHYLLQRRYFRRLWVLQELCLAKNIEGYLGKHSISPETLGKTAEWARKPTRENDEKVSRDTARVRQSLRPYGKSVPLIPRLLETRRMLQNGATISLEQWLDLCKGREASDPRDFINGGLALVHTDDLEINNGLHARDNQEALELWPHLKADYSFSTTDALRNLAACLLSRPGGISLLLSISSRVRDGQGIDADYSAAQIIDIYHSRLFAFPGSRAQKVLAIADHLSTESVGEFSAEDADSELRAMPSWIPNLGSFSSRFLDSFASQGVRTLTTCASLDNQPKISSNGTTLYLDAAKLTVVEMVCHSLLEKGQLPLIEFALNLPHSLPQYKNQNVLTVLAQTCLASTWAKGQDRNKEQVGLMRFFQSGRSDVREQASRSHWGKSSKSRTAEWTTLERAYEALEAKYPELRRKQKSGSESRIGERFNEDSGRLMAWRSLFVTKDGHLGLGPSWLEEGDQVMLVKGGHVPYIFRHVNRILMRKAQVIKDELADYKGTLSQVRREALQDLVRRTEEKIGQLEAWVLIGEAYVRGVMEDDTVVSTAEWQRVAIV